ncbi:MAG: GntR family transcriptional regulator [Paracoccaceae bacterium]
MAKPKPDQPDAQTRNDLLYDTIRERIFTNRYPPGSTLREGELAEEFGVSRSPIRRIFAKLEEARLLEIKHGVGAQVTEIRPDVYNDACEFRMLLAIHSGPFFVSPFPPDAPEVFQGFKDKLRELTPGDLVRFSEINNAYFTALTGLIRNRYMREVQLTLFFETARAWIIQMPDMDWDKTIAMLCDEIDETIFFIKREDPVGLGLNIRNGIFSAKTLFDQDAADEEDQQGHWSEQRRI